MHAFLKIKKEIILGSASKATYFYLINFIQGCLITSCLNGGSCLPDKENKPFPSPAKHLAQNSDCVIKNYLRTLFIFAGFKIREDRAKLRGKTIQS